MSVPFILSKLTEEQRFLALLKPDDDVPPEAFTVSTKGDNVRIGVALGMEFHFPRGVGVRLGRAADGLINVILYPSDLSQYNLGVVHRDSVLKFGGFRLVQVPKDNIEFLCQQDKIPQFRKKFAQKAIYTRGGEFLLAIQP
jgi:hypothetical protein